MERNNGRLVDRFLFKPEEIPKRLGEIRWPHRTLVLTRTERLRHGPRVRQLVSIRAVEGGRERLEWLPNQLAHHGPYCVKTPTRIRFERTYTLRRSKKLGHLYPESNGIAKRFNGTVRDMTGDAFDAIYLEAEATIAKLVHE